MLQLAGTWQARLAKSAFFAKPILDDGRVVWGRGTVLLKATASSTIGAGRADARLSALLAVAGGVAPSDDLLLLFKTVVADWQRGERALAAIRLAFAPVTLLDEDRAYRLFLAEQALDAGLDAPTVLREFGLGEAAVHYRKYSPGQPHVPAGNGRTSGQFASNGATSAESTEQGPGRVRTAFLDDGKIVVTAPPTAVPGVSDEKPHGLVFPHPPHPLFDPVPAIPGGLPLPWFAPPDAKTDEKEDDDGPACPAMRPDRSMIGNPAGDAVETRGALLVNPDDPTPKRPLSAAMAYFLSTSSPTGEVEYDDCKRSKVPALIPDMKKGDMAEFKAERAAWLIWQEWAQKDRGAKLRFDDQIYRQVTGIRLEHKGRSIFYMVGSKETSIISQTCTRRYTQKLTSSPGRRCNHDKDRLSDPGVVGKAWRNAA